MTCAVDVLRRGVAMPTDVMRGRVAVVTSSSAYLGDWPHAMVMVQSSERWLPGAMTASSIVLDGPLPSFTPGEHFEISRGELRIGPLSVALSDAPVWSASRGGKSNLGREHLLARFRSPWWMELTQRRELTQVSRNGFDLAAPVDALARAVHLGDFDGLATAVRSLVGFGPGLTPSGDDAIVGVLCSLGWIGERERFAALASLVIEHLSRTTLVSAHLLYLAATGHVPECVLGVLRALEAGEPRTIACAVQQLESHGASSGRDTLSGIIRVHTYAHNELVAA